LFGKILIADRGEIALRVIRACRELGISTVAVYSEADRHSLHVAFADEAVCIGPPPGEASYRKVAHIISAAELANADAIHPGYGPLAENAEFAALCAQCGIQFIGPPAEAIRRMGDKALARRSMAAAGVPIIPGSDGQVGSLEEARRLAAQIGYPLRLKAAAGGGGRGMRVVSSADELAESWHMATLEARSTLASDALYVERSVERARHIEIQLLGDAAGNLVFLGERECSIQRRHQKLLEESPSPAVSEELRRQLGAAAIAGARSVGYHSVGTVEFLVDPDLRFYFMEMNTRIQVEHPVTEMVSGVDLVKEQIRIAAGEPLGYGQDAVHLCGHAIECRINAEDPRRHFAPSPGQITALHFPGGPGVRVDSHLYQGYTMPPHYDSLLAKVITHGRDRPESLMRMRRALEEIAIDGIATTIPYHRALLQDPDFVAGRFDTEFVRRKQLDLGPLPDSGRGG